MSGDGSPGAGEPLPEPAADPSAAEGPAETAQRIFATQPVFRRIIAHAEPSTQAALMLTNRDTHATVLEINYSTIDCKLNELARTLRQLRQPILSLHVTGSDRYLSHLRHLVVRDSTLPDGWKCPELPNSEECPRLRSVRWVDDWQDKRPIWTTGMVFSDEPSAAPKSRRAWDLPYEYQTTFFQSAVQAAFADMMRSGGNGDERVAMGTEVAGDRAESSAAAQARALAERRIQETTTASDREDYGRLRKHLVSTIVPGYDGILYPKYPEVRAHPVSDTDREELTAADDSEASSLCPIWRMEAPRIIVGGRWELLQLLEPNNLGACSPKLEEAIFLLQGPKRFSHIRPWSPAYTNLPHYPRRITIVVDPQNRIIDGRRKVKLGELVVCLLEALVDQLNIDLTLVGFDDVNNPPAYPGTRLRMAGRPARGAGRSRGARGRPPAPAPARRVPARRTRIEAFGENDTSSESDDSVDGDDAGPVTSPPSVLNRHVRQRRPQRGFIFGAQRVERYAPAGPSSSPLHTIFGRRATTSITPGSATATDSTPDSEDTFTTAMMLWPTVLEWRSRRLSQIARQVVARHGLNQLFLVHPDREDEVPFRGSRDEIGGDAGDRGRGTVTVIAYASWWRDTGCNLNLDVA